MDKKRIGINYNISNSWIGGRYYLDSIINELCKNKEFEIIQLRKPFLMKCIGKIIGRQSRLYKGIFKILNRLGKYDIVFPAIIGDYSGRKNIYWIPDFQENYYPEFFTIDEITKRVNQQISIAYSNNILVLSSESAKNDFERIFPNHFCDVFVLSFVSSIAGKQINFLSMEILKKKYEIKMPYYVCSNQLWKHKNHIVIINAIQELKKKGTNVLCLFTGQEEDYRNPEYPESLKEIVKSYKLEDNIKFLGFIPRVDQLSLVKYSIAVIQPSLFEGWNTTIEDAKVLGKLIIASNLPVHREQLKENGVYFEVNDYLKLSEILSHYSKSEITKIDYVYSNQTNLYKNNLNKLFFSERE